MLPKITLSFLILRFPPSSFIIILIILLLLLVIYCPVYCPSPWAMPSSFLFEVFKMQDEAMVAIEKGFKFEFSFLSEKLNAASTVQL